jgi:hypothetical protein
LYLNSISCGSNSNCIYSNGNCYFNCNLSTQCSSGGTIYVGADVYAGCMYNDQKQCVNCYTYQDSTSCNANGCLWYNPYGCYSYNYVNAVPV